MDIAGCSYYGSYMASLTKRATSKFWVACFTDVAGRRLKKSTAMTDRKAAQRIADAFEEVATKKRTARQVRDVIAGLHKEITGFELPSHSFRQFSNSWLERKTPEVAAATLEFYQNVVSKFINFIGPKADTEMSDITQEDIISFRNSQARTRSSRTVNHDLKGLRMVFRAARADKVLVDDPTEFVAVTKKTESAPRRPFTVPELKAVLAVADPEWKSMIHFGLYTGQRLGDLAALTWQNIDLARGEIRLVAHKTDKTMILPIAAPLRKHLEALPKKHNADEPLHPSAHGIIAKHGRSGALSGKFAGLLAQAGLKEKQSHGKKPDGKGREYKRAASDLSFHCLRHTAVSMLKDAGIPASVVMELVGHDSVAMSELYTHTGMEALQRAAAALPEL